MNSLTRYLNININLFYLIFGNIGNLLKICFFLQKPLRSLPCTIYILFATISDFVTLNNLPVLQLLIHLYPNYQWIKVTVDWSNYENDSKLIFYTVSTYDIFMCKMRSYLHMLSTDLSSQMLVFASINRFFFSYYRNKRQKNRYRFSLIFYHFPHVHKLCFISSILCALISIHHILNFTILSASEGCIPRNKVLWVVWISVIHCFLLPLFMIIFGILTLNNLRHSSIFCICFKRYKEHTKKDRFTQMCSHCIRCRNSVQQKIDKQLTSMIISEIIVNVFTLLPYGTYTLYHFLYEIQVGKSQNHSYKTEWISFFIRMSMYFEASCGFYIYLITLTTLRKRFCKIFTKKLTLILTYFCYK
ncbi:unnamed protein product [Adineta steineri]|uniref:G-protein coupled receptors family 1 profile domain-containing protein n=3 Tax=Adineta steineri TaxID=433720 RepID=A0A815L992_9BILA|nr:unnamed protein product [Adineta steineri]